MIAMLCRMLPALALAALSLPSAHGALAPYYVSPDGSDSNAGTEQSPFATPSRAVEAARATSGERVIVLNDGTYLLDAPILLDHRDSGLIVRAAPAAKPILSGARTVTGWQPDSEGRWKAATDVADFRQLYVNGIRAVRARGASPEGVERYGSLEYIDGDAGHVFPDPAMADWRNPRDIELGYLVVWSHMICKVDAIERTDDGRARVRMQQPTFHLASRKEGVQAGLPGYIENALEVLDEPGEWYFDKPARTVYYRPREGENMAAAVVTVPGLETLLRVEGTPERRVQRVAFKGITFADAGWLRPNRIGHADVQANFICEDTNLFERDGKLVNVQNEHGKSPAAVVLHAVSASLFERCTFTRLGGAGLDIECGSQGNAVQGCRFHDISGSAVQIGDVLKADHHPDDPALIVKDNRVENCLIERCGVEYKGSVGIFAGYTDGTVIAHNVIRNLPYSGVSVGWGWGEPDAGAGSYPSPVKYETPTPAANNRIEANHIHHVMQEMNDGAAIYTLSNMPGSIIRDNLVHDCGPGGPGGIYLDEGSGFIEITGNVVYNVAKPMNYNNANQDRIKTCNEHDNFFDLQPGAADFPKDLAERAGLEPAYRALLPGTP